MKAIETRYAGYRFRSRLEARWAVFFQTLGLKWEYEPEGFDLGFGVRYLPDFRVWYPDDPVPVWFEVKPRLDLVTDEEWNKLTAFEAAAKARFLVLDGPLSMRVYLKPSDALSGCNDDPDAPPRSRKENLALSMRPSRLGVVLWSSKLRLWWDDECNLFTPGGADDTAIGDIAYRQLEHAVNEARGYRFGEGGRA